MYSEQFDTWKEAYDECREGNVPMLAKVAGEVLRIYPSGSCKPVIKTPNPATPKRAAGPKAPYCGEKSRALRLAEEEAADRPV